MNEGSGRQWTQERASIFYLLSDGGVEDLAVART